MLQCYNGTIVTSVTVLQWDHCNKWLQQKSTEPGVEVAGAVLDLGQELMALELIIVRGLWAVAGAPSHGGKKRKSLCELLYRSFVVRYFSFLCPILMGGLII